MSPPKLANVDSSVTPLSTHELPFHLWPTLMEITHTPPPKYQIQNYTVTLNTIPHTSRNTRCHHILLRHFVSNTNKPKLHESCSTKSKPYSMQQIKNFLCCVVKEKFRNSFVLPKKYSVREINNFPKRYTLPDIHIFKRTVRSESKEVAKTDRRPCPYYEVWHSQTRINSKNNKGKD